MTTQIIKEGVLNDDTLYIADDDKIFKGGYVAILEHYAFANAWSDVKRIKRFRNIDTMNKYVKRVYGLQAN